MKDSSESEPRSLPRFLQKRGVRSGLFVLVVFVTAVALFYAEENWRGSRAWKRHVEELSGQGERLDWFALLPPPVPSDQNFAMTPFLAPLFDFTPNRTPGQSAWRDTNAYNQTANFARGVQKLAIKGGWRKAEKLDLAAWQRAGLEGNTSRTNSIGSETTTNRAEAAKWILTRLAEYDSILAELRSASARPYARFPVRYEEPNPMVILLPHLTVLRQVCQILQLRAAAELELGRTAEALDDAMFILTISDSLKAEPILVSYLVRMANAGMSIQVIWEGMIDGRWSAAQMEQIKARLAKYDFISDLAHPLQAERAGGLQFIKYIENAANPGNEMATGAWPREDGTSPDTPFFSLWLMPHGWFDFEKINYVDLYPRFLAATSEGWLRQRGTILHQKKATEALANSVPGTIWSHTAFSRLLLPALGRMYLKAAEAQNAVNLAFTASNLEGHKQRHGHYPESLAQIADKEKLASDVITGELLKYRRDGAGKFVLYSVGSDERDDNGAVPKRAGAAESGDWVWTWPVKTD